MQRSNLTRRIISLLTTLVIQLNTANEYEKY